MQRARLKSLWNLSAAMAIADFRLRYAGSALGYFWSLSKPLMLFGVLYLVFDHFLRFGAGIPDYPTMLLLGIVLWTFFVETTTGCLTILVSRGDLIRKVPFPKIVLPVAVSLTSLLTLVLNLLAVLVFIVATGNEPSLTWLMFPLLIVELYLFAMGVSLLLSALYVSLRDIGQVWDVVLNLLFYATPIIYPIAIVPERFREVLMVNPLAQVIQDARIVLIGDNAATHTDVSLAVEAAPFVIVGVLLFMGAVVFARKAPQVAEMV